MCCWLDRCIKRRDLAKWFPGCVSYLTVPIGVPAYYPHGSIDRVREIHRNILLGNQNLQNSTKVAAGIDAKTMKKRGCVTDASLGALWKRLGSKRASRSYYPPDHFGRHFPLKSIKMPSKNHPKKRSRKSMEFIEKGSQNVAEFDAETHQKSMPKQVSKKSRKIMKIHVFLKG